MIIMYLQEIKPKYYILYLGIMFMYWDIRLFLMLKTAMLPLILSPGIRSLCCLNARGSGIKDLL